MAPDPREAFDGRETKPLCATGESDAMVALVLAIVWTVLVIVGVAFAVMVLA